MKCATEKKGTTIPYQSRIPDPAHHPSWKAGLFHKVLWVMQIFRFPACSAPVSYGQQDKHSLQRHMDKRSYAATLLLLYAPKPKRVRASTLKIFMTLSFISKCSWKFVVGSMSNPTSIRSWRVCENDLGAFSGEMGTPLEWNMRLILLAKETPFSGAIGMEWSKESAAQRRRPSRAI